MKKLKCFVLCFIVSIFMCFSVGAQKPLLLTSMDADLTIVIPNLYHDNQLLNLEVVLTYANMYEGDHIWFMSDFYPSTEISGDIEDVAKLDNILTIKLPNLYFENALAGLEIEFRYLMDYEGYHIWYLYSVNETKQDIPGVDNYGFDKDEFISEINKYRANGAPCSPIGGLAAVSWDDSLGTASIKHSADMAVNDYFNHTGLDGSSPWQRIRDEGFRGQPMGENIALGQRDVRGAVGAWVHSDGHCRNIMNSQVNVMGYGWAQQHRGFKYHTMVTGRKY